MTDIPREAVTALLVNWCKGDKAALDRVTIHNRAHFVAVAARLMRRSAGGLDPHR